MDLTAATELTAAMESHEPAPGDWTTEDLDALPDDGRRHELIDGVLIVSPSPSAFHQSLAMRLGVALERLCPPEYGATQAVDVRINGRRSLSPDVLVVTAESLDRNPSHFHPGDVLLAVEVVSPGTRVMDRTTKPALYAQAGIPFHWRIETTGAARIATFRLNVATDAHAVNDVYVPNDVYAPTGVFDDVVRLDEPFPITLPIAAIARRAAPGPA